MEDSDETNESVDANVVESNAGENNAGENNAGDNLAQPSVEIEEGLVSDPSTESQIAQSLPKQRVRKKRPNWSVRFVVGGFVLAVIGVTLAACYSDTGKVLDLNSHFYHQSLINRTFETWLGICFLAVGLCIGSFLNVVAWRMPRGMSINGHSICPRCRTRISSRDNMPVIGWLSLQGRCRSCRLPISIRYPTIELAVGVAFLLLYIFETHSQGVNLPYINPLDNHLGMLVLRLNPQLLTLSISHLWGVTFLVGIALIRLDSEQVPIRWVISGLLGWIGICMLWPDTMLVDWQTLPEPPADSLSERLRSAVTLFCGIAAGLAFGRLVLPLACPDSDGQLLRRDPHTKAAFAMLCSMALAGAVFGWQSFLSFAIVNCLVCLVGQPVANLFVRKPNDKRATPNAADESRESDGVQQLPNLGGHIESKTVAGLNEDDALEALAAVDTPIASASVESVLEGEVAEGALASGENIDEDEFSNPAEMRTATKPVQPFVDLALWSPVAYLITLSQWRIMHSKWWLSGPDRPVYIYAAIVIVAIAMIFLARTVAGRKISVVK